jgi:hypothetical protein
VMPSFPKIVNVSATSTALSRQQVTGAVLKSLERIGVDTTHYSCISMRRGGISAGPAARVPEPILFLQSGHGTLRCQELLRRVQASTQQYMTVHSSTRWYMSVHGTARPTRPLRDLPGFWPGTLVGQGLHLRVGRKKGGKGNE